MIRLGVGNYPVVGNISLDHRFSLVVGEMIVDVLCCCVECIRVERIYLKIVNLLVQFIKICLALCIQGSVVLYFDVGLWGGGRMGTSGIFFFMGIVGLRERGREGRAFFFILRLSWVVIWVVVFSESKGGLFDSMVASVVRG